MCQPETDAKRRQELLPILQLLMKEEPSTTGSGAYS